MQVPELHGGKGVNEKYSCKALAESQRQSSFMDQIILEGSNTNIPPTGTAG